MLFRATKGKQDTQDKTIQILSCLECYTHNENWLDWAGLLGLTAISDAFVLGRVQGFRLLTAQSDGLFNICVRHSRVWYWGAPVFSTTYNERLPAFSTGCLTPFIWFFS